MACFKTLSHHLHGVTKKKHGKSPSIFPASGPRFIGEKFEKHESWRQLPSRAAGDLRLLFSACACLIHHLFSCSFSMVSVIFLVSSGYMISYIM